MATVGVIRFASLVIVMVTSLKFVVRAEVSPTITVPPVDQTVAESGVASFYCRASGDPQPEVYWKRHGKRINTNRQRFLIIDSQPGVSVLRIEPARARRDDGPYDCVAENGVGSAATSSVRLTVYPEGPSVPSGYPRFTESPATKAIEQYRDAVIRCAVAGTPEPTVRWQKDLLPIDVSDTRLTVLPGGSLQIQNVSVSDEGKYECVAQNEYGIAYSFPANIFVQVQRVPPYFTNPPESVEVMPGGSATLSCVAVGSPMPFVRWRISTAVDTPDADENPASIGKSDLVLNNIQTSATYVCIANSQLGSINATAEVKVKALPKSPINLSMASVGPTAVKVTWSPGSAEPVDSYVVRHRLRHTEPLGDGSDETTDVVLTELTLSGLVPHTSYTVDVFAVNNIGRSLPATFDVTTAEDVPSTPPQNVRARPISLSTVVVQWEEPQVPNGVVKGYKVYFTLTPGLPMSAWSLHSVGNNQLTTISSLLPNQTYTVSVVAFTSIGDGPSSEPVLVKTILGVPEQPKNFVGVPLTSSSIRLTWDAPEVVGGSGNGDSVERYELYYNDTAGGRTFHVTISPPTTSYLLEELLPYTEYRISISAASTRGEGATTTPLTVRTLEAAPTAPPQSVHGEAVDSTSIVISWLPPPANHRNGVIGGYRVLYSEAGGSNDDDPTGSAVSTVSVPPTDSSYTVRGLRKWTQYNVWVLSFTSIGEGPRSDVIVVQTAEDVPGEPRRVKVESLNSTAISLQWRPPAEREQNGVIRGYLIMYVRLDERDEAAGESRVYDVMDANRLDAIIGNLEPEVQYQVQIAAYTRKGDGERSRPKKVRTKGAVLGAPRNVQLTLTQDDPPMFLAVWQAPRNVLSPILGYRVQYGIRGEEPEERLLDADRYRFQSPFLDRGVEYEFRVSAKNSVDFGEPAIEHIMTPEGVPAGAPFNVTASHVTTSSVRLRWNPPALRHRNGVIILYEVLYRPEANFIDEWTTNTSDTTILIEGLEISKEYQFQIRAFTARGSGPWSEHLQVRTASRSIIKPVGDALPAPTNVRIRRVSPSTMEVAWDVPPMATALGIVGYTVHYTQHVTPDVEQWPSVEAGPVTSVTVSRLEPHSSYAAAVRAKSGDGRQSVMSKIIIDNKIESDDAVQDFRDKGHTPSSVYLEWSHPKRADVLRYRIVYEGSKHYRDAAGVDLSLTDARGETILAGNERSALINALVPKTPYVFNISAGFANGNWGTVTTLHTETLPDAPPPMQQPLFNRKNADSSVTMRVFAASEKHGPITSYFVVVVTNELAERRPSDNFTLAELQEPGADRQVWIAVRYNSAALPKEVPVGDGSYSGTAEYYNRPLAKSRQYRIFVRGYVTENKYTSSPYSEPFSVELSAASEMVTASLAPAGMELVWIVAPICIAIVLILLIVLITVYVRKRTCKKEPRHTGVTKVLLPPGEPLYSQDPVELRRLNFQTPGMANHPPIPVAQLPDYVAQLRNGDGEGYSREYESIEPGQPFTWDASSAEVNKSKNRYANVVAYDHSRVVLQAFEDVPGSDYINANFMDGYCRPKAYIATQGPLVETFGDFWRMIWEQQVTTIVMMTKLEERNRIKCDQYWPNRGTEIYGMVQVTITDVLELATFTVRTFQISLGNYLDKREVRQFQFTAWPDHGVPEHPLPLLQFIRRVKALTLQDGAPTVVHCSAGVGRTGTYIVIDAMLDRIKHERTVDVYGHVTVLRSQRNYMVQTEDQYVFIYEALLDAVESGCTEVPAESLYVIIQQLTSMYAVDGNDPTQRPVTGMELEFKKLSNIKGDPAKFGSASLPVNKLKNRLVNILPYESSRVPLQPIRGVDGSDYINASFIDGYRYRKTYIATQGPLMETTEDFWRMLWEHNCSIIVMMTKVKEMGMERCHQYWPEERSARYQYFVVDPLAQYNMPLYILREFKVTDARDGQSRTVRQFQFTDWPEQGVPASGDGFIEFIGHVQKTKDQFGQDGPITVHCSTGVGRTGVFITLSIVLERMRYEGLVDMYQTVRMLRTQRPAMVQTEDQYAFCYRAALEYLSSFDHYAS